MSVDCILDSENPFDGLQSGTLTLSGYVKEARLEYNTATDIAHPWNFLKVMLKTGACARLYFTWDYEPDSTFTASYRAIAESCS